MKDSDDCSSLYDSLGHGTHKAIVKGAREKPAEETLTKKQEETVSPEKHVFVQENPAAQARHALSEITVHSDTGSLGKVEFPEDKGPSFQLDGKSVLALLPEWFYKSDDIGIAVLGIISRLRACSARVDIALAVKADHVPLEEAKAIKEIGINTIFPEIPQDLEDTTAIDRMQK